MAQSTAQFAVSPSQDRGCGNSGGARGVVRKTRCAQSFEFFLPPFLAAIRRDSYYVLADLERTSLANCVCSNAAFTKPFEDF